MTAAAPSAGSAARSALARWLFWIVLGLIGVLAATAIQLLDADDSETFGLGNTDLDGYAALASVLDDEGVEIHRAYSAEAARDLLAEHSGASVVVMARGFQPEQAFVSELQDQHRDGREVLWLSDDASLLTSTLGDQLQAGQPIPTGAAGTAQVLQAGEACSLEAAAAAESMQAEGETLRSEAGCFALDADDAASSYVLAETSYGLAFTAPEAFTNQHITAEGNAALGLGLLGGGTDSASGDLIWYTPSGADEVGADQWASPMDYLPGWFWPAAAWLLICGLLALVVAGRRHGPVVAEPLPVTVPASESAHGRGRLYQRSNAVAATARTLRSAHLLRLGRLLRLGPTPEAEVIAAAAARESRWDEERVRRLLVDPEVGNHDQLTSYAQELARLEHEVLHSTRMRRRP